MDQPCGRCGNIVPAWANGVCQVCARIEAEAQRYGTARSSRPRRSLELDLPLDHEPIPPASAAQPLVAAPADSADAGFLPQLEGINRLLRALYGRPVWLGEILQTRGITAAQLAAWRADPAWLAGYVGRVIHHIAAVWATIVPAAPVQVLWAWYGIGRPQLRTPALIADALGISLTVVAQSHPAFLAALQQPAGQTAFEAGLAAATGDQLTTAAAPTPEARA